MTLIINGELPKDEKYPLSCVYWIHTPEMTDPKTQGYIGVSSAGYRTRWSEHKSKARKGSSLVVHNAIRKYHDIKITELFRASPEFCSMVEHALRPLPCISWNLSVGGEKTRCGVSVSEANKLALSVRMKGVPKTPSQKLLMSLSSKQKMWENNGACKVAWLNCIEIHKSFKDTSSQTSVANKFSISKSVVFHMYKRFSSGWNPNEDQEYLSWLEEKKETICQNIAS